MVSSLLISVSGLRGVVGDSLTADVAFRYAWCFGQSVAPADVVVGKDSRPHGDLLYHAAIAGLLEAGCRPLLAGHISTPTCGVLVQSMGAAGGLSVTASHNPPEWNGIKVFESTGRVLRGTEGARLADRFRQHSPNPVPWDQVQRPNVVEDPHEPHLERVLNLVDRAVVQRRRFRVVLDSNHGAGGLLGARLLQELGCDLVGIALEPTGQFLHPPEPTPQNLQEIAQQVPKHGAAVGFAQDPDADRLVLIDETGTVLSEELTLALVVDYYFRRHSGPLVINLSTSRITEEVARRRGADVYRAPVGEANVVDRALEVGAKLAGEGNGGVIHGDVVWVRDSFTAMALILAAMAESGKALSQWASELPRWSMVKRRVDVDREQVSEKLEKLPSEFPKATANFEDGVRLETPDWWLHVRLSNTEPIARVIAEARSLEEASRLADRAVRWLRHCGSL